jgi:outer membrane protein assembly factor BamA
VPLHYYRVRYKYVAADLLLRKRYKNILSLAAGPTYYHYWNRYEDNKGRILDDPSITGPDSISVYGIKDYLGLKAKMDITYLDNEVFPTRGITWFTELTAVNGLNDNSHALTKLSSDMTIYAKVSDISRVSAVLRAGAGYIFSRQYEYFQAFNLGANNYLRGYRKNRFSGSSMMYGSLEGHFRLFKSASHVLPGDVGLLAFYEAGRVWVKNDLTKKWHQSVGGGLYFTPFNLIMLSAALGYSQESTLFNFTIGTKFNLTF